MSAQFSILIISIVIMLKFVLVGCTIIRQRSLGCIIMVYITSNKKYPIFISSSIPKYSCTVMPVYNSKIKIVQLKVS